MARLDSEAEDTPATRCVHDRNPTEKTTALLFYGTYRTYRTYKSHRSYKSHLLPTKRKARRGRHRGGPVCVGPGLFAQWLSMNSALLSSTQYTSATAWR